MSSTWSFISLERVQTQLSQNPVNWVLLFFALLLLEPTVKHYLSPAKEVKPEVHSTPDAYNWLPPAYPESKVYARFTPAQLEPFNGTNGKPIFLAVNRNIFDVSLGKNFYGPGGPYENFAGRDASRGMAKQSFEPDVLTPVDAPIDDLKDLTPSEMEAMKDWESHFSGKYTLVGELVDA